MSEDTAEEGPSCKTKEATPLDPDYFQPTAPVDPSYFGNKEKKLVHVDEALTWRLTPITFASSRSRIVSVETVNIRIRIREWRLHPIALSPVIYPAIVPKIDPRYVRKRCCTLLTKITTRSPK